MSEPSTPTSSAASAPSLSSIDSPPPPSTPPNLHQNTIVPEAKWLVQKYGGTSVGKFASQIAENIVPYAHFIRLMSSNQNRTYKLFRESLQRLLGSTQTRDCLLCAFWFNESARHHQPSPPCCIRSPSTSRTSLVASTVWCSDATYRFPYLSRFAHRFPTRAAQRIYRAVHSFVQQNSRPSPIGTYNCSARLRERENTPR